MIHKRPPRPRLATLGRLLAALTLLVLTRGGAAWAGPFTVIVETEVYEPDSSTSGMVPFHVMLDLSVDGQDWYMTSFNWIDPRNGRGETLGLYSNHYTNWYDLQWETGKIYVSPGTYLFWPHDPFGRFTGGRVIVTAARYAEDDYFHSYPIDERTVTADFGFVVPRPPGVVPEPAAAIPAVTAALGGAAFAASRRRRAG